jgi:hypothetical protein
VRFRVSFFVAALAPIYGSSANADDIGAAARGVVRVIVVAQDYSNEDNSSISFGSGFAISPHRVVTNAHVVESAQNPYADSVIAVVPAEGRKPLQGRILAYDRTRDLAILDVGSTRLEPLTIYVGPVTSGEHSAALGYPGNVDLATARSIYDLITPSSPVRSEGNISSERSVDGLPALLHTAAIARGNSGGPLVDDCGRILGVNTYVTNSGSGDAPFGFAVVSQELTSFLRENGEAFQQIGTACITYAEQQQRDQQERDAAARDQAAAQQRAAAEQRERVDAARAHAEDSRDNHTAAAGLLAVLSLIAAGFGIALFLKDRTRAAAAASVSAAVALFGASYAFLSRPSLDVKLPPAAISAEAGSPPLSGQLTCRVQPELSRVTVSSTDDLPINWDNSGCLNGKTQYVEVAGRWSRVLVPNGSETAYVQEFDPKKSEYVSTRYLLSQSEMEHLRQIRGETAAKKCSLDTASLEQLEQLTDQLKASLPPQPNEKLVYRCTQATSVGDSGVSQ